MPLKPTKTTIFSGTTPWNRRLKEANTNNNNTVLLSKKRRGAHFVLQSKKNTTTSKFIEVVSQQSVSQPQCHSNSVH
jgi:hypothetical protein